MTLTAPRLLTFIVSIVLVGLALASYRMQIPTVAHFVVEHRFWMLVGGYVVLAAGVLVRGL